MTEVFPKTLHNQTFLPALHYATDNLMPACAAPSTDFQINSCKYR